MRVLFVLPIIVSWNIREVLYMLQAENGSTKGRAMDHMKMTEDSSCCVRRPEPLCLEVNIDGKSKKGSKGQGS